MRSIGSVPPSSVMLLGVASTRASEEMRRACRTAGHIARLRPMPQCEWLSVAAGVASAILPRSARLRLAVRAVSRGRLSRVEAAGSSDADANAAARPVPDGTPEHAALERCLAALGDHTQIACRCTDMLRRPGAAATRPDQRLSGRESVGASALTLVRLGPRDSRVLTAVADTARSDGRVPDSLVVVLAALGGEIAASYADRFIRPEQIRRAMLARLSPVQREIASLLDEPLSEQEIAASLGRNRHTVHEHVRAIYRTLGLRSREEFRLVSRGMSLEQIRGWCGGTA